MTKFCGYVIAKQGISKLFYVQKGTVWKFNPPGLQCFFKFTYSSRPQTIRDNGTERRWEAASLKLVEVLWQQGWDSGQILDGKLSLLYKVQSPNSLSNANPQRIHEPMGNCSGKGSKTNRFISWLTQPSTTWCMSWGLSVECDLMLTEFSNTFSWKWEASLE